MRFEERLERLISPFLFFILCEVFQKNQYISYKMRLLLGFGSLLMRLLNMAIMPHLLEMSALVEDSLIKDIDGNM
jgi:hypothetical protein